MWQRLDTIQRSLIKYAGLHKRARDKAVLLRWNTASALLGLSAAACMGLRSADIISIPSRALWITIIAIPLIVIFFNYLSSLAVIIAAEEDEGKKVAQAESEALARAKERGEDKKANITMVLKLGYYTDAIVEERDLLARYLDGNSTVAFDPRSQRHELVRNIHNVFANLLSDDGVGKHLEVVLAKMGKEFVEDFEVKVPTDFRFPLSVSSLQVPQAAFSVAKKEKVPRLFPCLKEAVLSQSYVLASKNKEELDGCILVYPIEIAGDVPYVISVKVAMRNALRAERESSYCDTLREFAARIAHSYLLEKYLKEKGLL